MEDEWRLSQWFLSKVGKNVGQAGVWNIIYVQSNLVSKKSSCDEEMSSEHYDGSSVTASYNSRTFSSAEMRHSMDKCIFPSCD